MKAGEIDIVALDGETLVFVEVKSRQSDSFGEPAEAVDAKKRKKYGLVARAYLQRSGDEDRECRFDVIEVTDKGVNHIPAAFLAGE